MATILSTSTPRVGEAAPDFSLDATAGSPVRLADHRDHRHVLVAFFPLAFRRGTDELLSKIEALD